MCSSQYKVAARTHTHIQAARTGWELLWEPSIAGDGGGGGERERERTGSGERERLDSFRHHRSVLKQQFLEGSFPVRAVD